MCLDSVGNLFVSDSMVSTVRFIDVENELIYTIVGTSESYPDFSGDFGPAVDAKLIAPHGVFVSTDGTVFIADSANLRVRATYLSQPTSVPTAIPTSKPTAVPTSIPTSSPTMAPVYYVTSVAGTGVSGSAGDGFAASSA